MSKKKNKRGKSKSGVSKNYKGIRNKSSIPQQKDFSRFAKIYQDLKKKEELKKRSNVRNLYEKGGRLASQKGSNTFLRFVNELGYSDYIYLRDSAWLDFKDFVLDEVMHRANRNKDRSLKDYESILDLYNYDFKLIGDMVLSGNSESISREIVREFIARALSVGILLPPDEEDENEDEYSHLGDDI